MQIWRVKNNTYFCTERVLKVADFIACIQQGCSEDEIMRLGLNVYISQFIQIGGAIFYNDCISHLFFILMLKPFWHL